MRQVYKRRNANRAPLSSGKIYESSKTVFSTTRELVFSSIFVDGNLVNGSRPSPTAHWEAVVGGLMCLAHSRTVEQGRGRTVLD